MRIDGDADAEKKIIENDLFNISADDGGNNAL